ncbi:MAG TPA: hypothetical protein VMU38_11190 [Candidatus Binatia bacterium]|nr:hypothetical protein [Candidatus Binatia bacterium]
MSYFSIARRALIAATALAVAGCALPADHTAADYAKAVAIGNPDGYLTLIVGPATPIVKMSSTLKFPQGDTQSDEHSLLMYDRPGDRPGTCVFQIGYAASRFSQIVKTDPIVQPCDGKRQARFHIAGKDVAFVAHLVHENYKGTPVTILEIGDHQAPESLHLVY